MGSASSTQHRLRLLLLALVFEGGVGLVAFAGGWVFGVSPVQHVSHETSAWLWGLLAALPMLVLAFAVERSSWTPLRRLRDVVDREVVPIFAHSTVLDFALIATAAGIGEELLFRGLIQQGLTDWLGSPVIALAIASLVFGAMHPISLEYFVIVTIVGVYLGWLYLATDNLLVPIVAHGLYDFLMLIYLVGWREERTIAETVESPENLDQSDTISTRDQ